jgi:malate permease and related proteins
MGIIAQSIFWIFIGLLLIRLQFVKPSFPQLLGRGLYWIGVPLQIFALGHRSNFPEAAWLPLTATVVVLLAGFLIATFCWQKIEKRILSWINLAIPIGKAVANLQQPQLQLQTADASFYLSDTQLYLSDIPPQIDLKKQRLRYNKFFNYLSNTQHQRFLKKQQPRQNKFFSEIRSDYFSSKGSFILASMLGNTVFVGFALVPTLVDRSYWSWVVLYGIANYLIGSYGVGVMVANYFGCAKRQKYWWEPLQKLLTVPVLWGFILGWFSKNIQFPAFLEFGMRGVPVVVISIVFLLIGMQLSRLQNLQSLQGAIVPTILKMLVLPGLTGLICTLAGLQGDACLVLVLMAGMPTNSANAILAEEYNLNREVSVSSIILTMIVLPLTVPLWLAIF